MLGNPAAPFTEGFTLERNDQRFKRTLDGRETPIPVREVPSSRREVSLLPLTPLRVAA